MSVHGKAWANVLCLTRLAALASLGASHFEVNFGSILGSIWDRFWGRFGVKSDPKIDKKSMQERGAAYQKPVKTGGFCNMLLSERFF